VGLGAWLQMQLSKKIRNVYPAGGWKQRDKKDNFVNNEKVPSITTNPTPEREPVPVRRAGRCNPTGSVRFTRLTSKVI
jgi:hypothetical protein